MYINKSRGAALFFGIIISVAVASFVAMLPSALAASSPNITYVQGYDGSTTPPTYTTGLIYPSKFLVIYGTNLTAPTGSVTTVGVQGITYTPSNETYGYISPTQINVQLDNQITPGSASIVIRNITNGGTGPGSIIISNTATATVGTPSAAITSVPPSSTYYYPWANQPLNLYALWQKAGSVPYSPIQGSNNSLYWSVEPNGTEPTDYPYEDWADSYWQRFWRQTNPSPTNPELNAYAYALYTAPPAEILNDALANENIYLAYQFDASYYYTDPNGQKQDTTQDMQRLNSAPPPYDTPSLAQIDDDIASNTPVPVFLPDPNANKYNIFAGAGITTSDVPLGTSDVERIPAGAIRQLLAYGKTGTYAAIVGQYSTETPPPELPSNSVTWEVNGIVGGNATVGTITPSGLYTAPATVGPDMGATITAWIPNTLGNPYLTDNYIYVGSFLLGLIPSGGTSPASTTPSFAPLVGFDAPCSSWTGACTANVSGASVTFAGWALDNGMMDPPVSKIGTVSISIDRGAPMTATYGVPRQDVCNNYPNRPGCPFVGWNFNWNSTAVANGSHTVTVTATDTTSPSPNSATATITVNVENGGTNSSSTQTSATGGSTLQSAINQFTAELQTLQSQLNQLINEQNSGQGTTPTTPQTNTSFPATITVTATTLNVRPAPHTSAAPNGLAQLHAGDTFTATDEVTGDNVEGDDLWWETANGTYIWSGGTIAN